MHFIILFLFLLAQSPVTHSAIVTSSEATFTMPFPHRDRWSWRLPETPANKMEYRMDVTVTNEGRQYTFGFYLWKRGGESSGSGSLNDLLSTGQKSLFERSDNRLMTVIHDADVKVKTKADALIITLRNKDELKRLFSSKPTEVVFKLKLPGEDETIQNVAVVYQ